MKKISVLLFVLLLANVSFSQTKLTLDDAIKIALQRNSALVKAEYNLKNTKASVQSAYGNLLPSFGITSGWNWGQIEDPGGTQLDALGNPYTIPATSTNTRNYTVGVGGSVTLFNGLANYANIASAKRDDEAAILSIDKFKRDVVQQATILYYTILKNKALLKVKEENYKYNSKLLETITEKNKLGSAPIADLYAQQVQAGSAEVDLIRAQNGVDASENSLINYLALDVLKEYEFVSRIDTVNEDNIDYYSKEFNDISNMVDYALINRTDYLSQQKSLESASEGITMAQGGFWPSLTGGYSFSTSAVAVDDLFDRKVLSLNLNLSFPIFSNFNTKTSVQFAKVRELSVAEDLRALERQIKIEIKQGYLDYQAVSKALEVAIKTVISASENRRVQYERYNLGSGTFLDVLQSDRDYQNALSLRIDAEFNFHSAREALLNSLGKLDYKDFEIESNK